MNTYNLARGLKAGNPKEWLSRNRVNIPNVKEVIWEPLYDTVTYPAAGASSLILFQDQIGKSGKTLSQTNMDLDGQLPSGKALKVVSVQLAFYSGFSSNLHAPGQVSDVTNDVRTFTENGSLKFRINSKEFLRQAPLGKFPPAERLDGFTAQATSKTVAGNSIDYTDYAVAAGRVFSISGLLLESNQNFHIELNDLPALPSGVDGRIVCTLNGWLGRNAQ